MKLPSGSSTPGKSWLPPNSRSASSSLCLPLSRSRHVKNGQFSAAHVSPGKPSQICLALGCSCWAMPGGSKHPALACSPWTDVSDWNDHHRVQWYLGSETRGRISLLQPLPGFDHWFYHAIATEDGCQSLMGQLIMPDLRPGRARVLRTGVSDEELSMWLAAGFKLKGLNQSCHNGEVSLMGCRSPGTAGQESARVAPSTGWIPPNHPGQPTRY